MSVSLNVAVSNPSPPPSGIRSTCNSIGNALTSYYNTLPNHTFYNAGVSFVTSFVAGSVLSGNVALGIVCGVIGSLATLIHAITTPIFVFISKQLNLHTDRFESWLEFGRRVAILFLVAIIVSTITAYSVHLLFSTILMGAIMFIHNGIAPYPVNTGMTYLIV